VCIFDQRIAAHGDILQIGPLWSVAQMRRKPKAEIAGMWINPNSTLSRGHIAWDRRKTDSMNSRYLDLAEVALRAKIAQPQEPAVDSESRKATTDAALVSANPTQTES
jgi:hypothetical protein